MNRKHASDFPQDLLNLFDRYVHGEISRRDFFERGQKFAVGGLAVIRGLILFERSDRHP